MIFEFYICAYRIRQIPLFKKNPDDNSFYEEFQLKEIIFRNINEILRSSIIQIQNFNGSQ